MTYSGTKFEVVTSNGLGGGTLTRSMADGRRTDFVTKLIYSYFLKKKAGITRIPNARMLNIWLNIKNNCSMKKIKKTGTVMQQPMDSCVCGINTSSESKLIRSYLVLAR